MLYIFIIFLLLVLTYCYDYRGYDKGRNEWYLVCLLILIFVGGLRYRLGTDTIVYEDNYKYDFPSLSEYASYDFESTRYGRGFILLAAIARSISGNFVVLQFLHAIFVNSVVFWFFKKYTQHRFFAILLYFIFEYLYFTFEIMRESCAVSMFLIGWQYFLANKWGKYYICAIIAVLFHPSALILFVLPIFNLPIFRPFFRFGIWYWSMVGAVLVISAIISVKFFDIIRLIELTDAQNYAATYEDSYFGESKNLNILGFAVLILREVLYVYIAIVLLRRKYVDDYIVDKLEYIVCISIYLTMMALSIRILDRFTNYISPFVILAISEAMFSKIKLKSRNLIMSFTCWMLLIMPYISIKCYGYFTEDRDSGIKIIRKYYPYESVLNPVKNKEREMLYHAKRRY